MTSMLAAQVWLPMPFHKSPYIKVIAPHTDAKPRRNRRTVWHKPKTFPCLHLNTVDAVSENLHPGRRFFQNVHFHWYKRLFIYVLKSKMHRKTPGLGHEWFFCIVLLQPAATLFVSTSFALPCDILTKTSSSSSSRYLHFTELCACSWSSGFVFTLKFHIWTMIVLICRCVEVKTLNTWFFKEKVKWWWTKHTESDWLSF